MRIGVLFAIGALCASCNDSKFMSMGDMAGRDLSGGGGGDLAGAGDMAMMGGAIPDPGTGNNVDNNFGEVEPNDTPQQATPLGISLAPMGVYAWVSGNMLGGANDPADYFVFKCTNAGPFSMNACGSAPLTNLSATIWTVQNNMAVDPPLHQWTGVNNCIMTQPTDAVLQANTTYLLGFFPTGGPGLYSA